MLPASVEGGARCAPCRPPRRQQRAPRPPHQRSRVWRRRICPAGWRGACPPGSRASCRTSTRWVGINRLELKTAGAQPGVCGGSQPASWLCKSLAALLPCRLAANLRLPHSTTLAQTNPYHLPTPSRFTSWRCCCTATGATTTRAASSTARTGTSSAASSSEPRAVARRRCLVVQLWNWGSTLFRCTARRTAALHAHTHASPLAHPSTPLSQVPHVPAGLLSRPLLPRRLVFSSPLPRCFHLQPLLPLRAALPYCHSFLDASTPI